MYAAQAPLDKTISRGLFKFKENGYMFLLPIVKGIVEILHIILLLNHLSRIFFRNINNDARKRRNR